MTYAIRCSALPTELTSWLLSWFQIKPWSDELMTVNIWISYMWTVEKEMNLHEFISRTGLNFFWRYFHYCLNSVHYCEDRFQIHTIYWRRRQNRKIIQKLQTSLGKPYTLSVWSRGKTVSFFFPTTSSRETSGLSGKQNNLVSHGTIH